MTPTDDLGVVLNAVHGISMEGTINFPTGVQGEPPTLPRLGQTHGPRALARPPRKFQI